MNIHSKYMERKVWALVVINAAQYSGLTGLALQHSLFLFGQMYPEDVSRDYYQFVPGDYGPYSAAVYEDTKRLEVNDLIYSQPISRSGWWYGYRVTDAGSVFASTVTVEQAVIDKVQELVTWTKTLAFTELFRYVNARFPEYGVNSVFSDRQQKYA